MIESIISSAEITVFSVIQNQYTKAALPDPVWEVTLQIAQQMMNNDLLREGIRDREIQQDEIDEVYLTGDRLIMIEKYQLEENTTSRIWFQSSY